MITGLANMLSLRHSRMDVNYIHFLILPPFRNSGGHPFPFAETTEINSAPEVFFGAYFPSS